MTDDKTDLVASSHERLLETAGLVSKADTSQDAEREEWQQCIWFSGSGW